MLTEAHFILEKLERYD
eukprot:UN06472